MENFLVLNPNRNYEKVSCRSIHKTRCKFRFIIWVLLCPMHCWQVLDIIVTFWAQIFLLIWLKTYSLYSCILGVAFVLKYKLHNETYLSDLSSLYLTSSFLNFLLNIYFRDYCRPNAHTLVCPFFLALNIILSFCGGSILRWWFSLSIFTINVLFVILISTFMLLHMFWMLRC